MNGRPVFSGRFASGPADDRFVYLSWRSVPRGTWINRVKARLSTINAPTLHSMRAGDVLLADLTGWLPGDKRKHVAWRVIRSNDGV